MLKPWVTVGPVFFAFQFRPALLGQSEGEKQPVLERGWGGAIGIRLSREEPQRKQGQSAKIRTKSPALVTAVSGRFQQEENTRTLGF